MGQEELQDRVDRLYGALDELASAVRDGLRRHKWGDPNAIASDMIRVCLAQAHHALGQKHDESAG